MKSFLLRILPLLAWLGIILILSSIPRRYDFIPTWFWHSIYPWPPFNLFVSWEELLSASIHMGLFMGLAFFLARLIIRPGKFNRPLYFGVFILVILISFGDEIYQRSIPERGFELNDLYMDTIGALIGLGLFLVWDRRSRLKDNRFPASQDDLTT